jgi:hypothetical protein
VSIKGIFGKTASINLILKACYPWVSRQKVQIIKSPLIVDELLNFEARQQIQSYKFGVLFCKEGQTKEEEMFSNGSFSPNPTTQYHTELTMLFCFVLCRQSTEMRLLTPFYSFWDQRFDSKDGLITEEAWIALVRHSLWL